MIVHVHAVNFRATATGLAVFSYLITLMFATCDCHIYSSINTDKPRSADLEYSNIIFHGKPKIATISSYTSTVDMADVGVSLSIQEPLDHGEKLEFKVHPCLAGPFVLPADYEAASPVYLIQPITAGEIHTDVTVCIHHCASLKSEEDCRNMRFLSATSQEEASPIYTFTEMKRVAEKFKEGKKIGEIAINEFGLFVVAMKGRKGL